MKPNDKRSYSDLCSKNLIDFTNLDQFEISEILKKSGNRICARLTKTQLNSPLLNLSHNFKFIIPKSDVGTGLMLATSLMFGKTLHAENQNVKTEFIQSSDTTLNSKKEKPSSKPSEPKLDDLTIFKGNVTSEELGATY